MKTISIESGRNSDGSLREIRIYQRNDGSIGVKLCGFREDAYLEEDEVRKIGRLIEQIKSEVP